MVSAHCTNDIVFRSPHIVMQLSSRFSKKSCGRSKASSLWVEPSAYLIFKSETSRFVGLCVTIPSQNSFPFTGRAISLNSKGSKGEFETAWATSEWVTLADIPNLRGQRE